MPSPVTGLAMVVVLATAMAMAMTMVTMVVEVMVTMMAARPLPGELAMASKESAWMCARTVRLGTHARSPGHADGEANAGANAGANAEAGVWTWCGS